MIDSTERSSAPDLPEIIDYFRQVRTETERRFGPTSPLLPLLSEKMLDWLVSAVSGMGSRTTDIAAVLEDAQEDVATLQKHLAEVVAERTNLESALLEQRRARLNEFATLEGVSERRRADLDALYRHFALVYADVEVALASLCGIRDLMVATWLENAALDPSVLRPLVVPSIDRLQASTGEHSPALTRAWGTDTPSRIVTGEAVIQVRVSGHRPERQPQVCAEDCASEQGHSHAFDGDGDAG
jgi:hypothetical protein